MILSLFPVALYCNLLRVVVASSKKSLSNIICIMKLQSERWGLSDMWGGFELGRFFVLSIAGRAGGVGGRSLGVSGIIVA
jgi:hypothetical protein